MIIQKNIRNLAIIAHVDHGKTTLLDKLLAYGGFFHEKQEVNERLMDSGDIEKERGITITAKCTALQWQDYYLNIVDTPGHADFGGEVERILNMVDGALILVDAAEGIMPQTKFVLTKALAQNLKPIVVINKIDRPDERATEVLDEIFDLFVALGASEDQLDFPVLYASAKQGFAKDNKEDEPQGMEPLLKSIITHIPAPKGDLEKPFRFLATMTEADAYVGKLLTGKIYSGDLVTNMHVAIVGANGVVAKTRVSKIFKFNGLEKITVEKAYAGDIVTIAGCEAGKVGNTITSLEDTTALPTIVVDPPTISVDIGINTSPLSGQDGTKLTTRVLRDRLFQEAETNVSIAVEEKPNAESFKVSARGELQIGILVENLRREGFEVSISRPQVIYKYDDTGSKLEPIEEAIVDVDEEYVGKIMEALTQRRGELQDMFSISGNKTRLIFSIPSRGLIGYRQQMLTDSAGTAILNGRFLEYQNFKGAIGGAKRGALISSENGKGIAYALWNIEERGKLFITPGTDLYVGMIIGENARPHDLEVNPTKQKKLTNIRASGKDESIRLTPIKPLNLEWAITYIEDDELVEVTPKNIRIRKKILDPNMRKRSLKKTSS